SVAILAENRTAWDEVRRTVASVVGPDGLRRDVELRPAGPGRYRAELATAEAGSYLIQASQVVEGGEVRGEAGWVAPYSAEYRQVGIDAALLAKVAAAGGGRVLTDAAEAMRPPDEAAAARWPAAQLLLVLAAIFWP